LIVFKSYWPALSVGALLCLAAIPARAESQNPSSGDMTFSGKLLLTGGVSQVEGAAGGGLTPWAVIGGYGTKDQIGGNIYYTNVDTTDFDVRAYGVLVGIHDRIEISAAHQDFDTQDIGTALGLGKGYTIGLDTIGIKVKLAGDAVLDQDTWLPQISVGAQFKSNKRGALVKALGARDDSGTDLYVSATKLYLDRSLLVNATIRATKANQFGFLGFGGKDEQYHAEFEGSAAWLLSKHLAVGAEVRIKPDNLAVAKEGAAADAFVAYAPCKRVSFTLAYADLGNIVVGRQTGTYLSMQIGF
jgi:hypothetical protein